MPEAISLKIESNVAVPMRDGVTLYADIYRPEGNGQFATILQRTPYDKTTSLTNTMLDPIRAAKAGFAVIIQDTRGRHSSEGEFYAFRDDINDGYDTVEWAAAQHWSTGKVGMFGASYVGATQWLAAISRPPHLVTIAPTVTASNYHDGWTYQGGAFELGFNMSWTLLQLTLSNFSNVSRVQNVARERRAELIHDVDNMTEGFGFLPTKDFPGLDSGMAKYYYDWLAHPDFDDYWQALCIEVDGIHLRWFDHWLKDDENGITEEAPVRIFVLGDNLWREEQEWPLARAVETKYYLHSAGKANSKNGDGTLNTDAPKTEQTDVFLYNPADPVPTTGGALCCNPNFAANGAYDQNQVENRQDVLVYSTPVLAQDVEVTGPVTVSLWASTSATDTDFTAKLVDVCEEGCARNLTDGIIRARYRNSMSNPALIEPGKAYCYDIDLWATSNVFKAGHRIRLEISSSNFPRFDRNTNTGNIIAEDTELMPALQTVFHDSEHPSYVSLALVPR